MDREKSRGLLAPRSSSSPGPPHFASSPQAEEALSFAAHPGEFTFKGLAIGRGTGTIAAFGRSWSAVDGFRFVTISEAIMKAILSVAVVLGLSGLVGAADDKAADPVGTWKCEYEVGGQQRTSTLKIKKDGDKLTGTMDWPGQEGEKLKDVKFKDGKLTFSAVRKFMDNEIPIDYTLTIDGGAFKGKGEAEFGGQKQEFDIEGKREKKDE